MRLVNCLVTTVCDSANLKNAKWRFSVVARTSPLLGHSMGTAWAHALHLYKLPREEFTTSQIDSEAIYLSEV